MGTNSTNINNLQSVLINLSNSFNARKDWPAVVASNDSGQLLVVQFGAEGTIQLVHSSNSGASWDWVYNLYEHA